MTIYPYESLDSTQQLLLSFYAYIGGGITENQFSRLNKVFKLPKDEIKKAIQNLREEKLLINDYFLWWNDYRNYLHNPTHYFYVIDFLTEKHADWLKTFQDAGFQQNAYHKQLFSLHKALRSNNTVALSSFKYNGDIIPYFLPVAMDEKYCRLMLYFPEGLFSETFNRILVYLQETDTVDTKDLLPDLLSQKKLSTAVKTELKEVLALYRYYSHGEYTLGNKIPERLYPLLLAGVRSVHLGKYAEAVDLLGRALKIRNKESQIKNLFVNFLNCFYLIMAYVHEGTPGSHTKIEQFMRKKVTLEMSTLLPALIVAEAFTNQERDASASYIQGLLTFDKFADMTSYQWLGFLFNRYFDKKINIDAPAVTPNQAVLRHELSAYLPLGNEEREYLQSLFGTTPVLTSIYRKQAWEWAIEDLLQDAQGKANGTHDLVQQTDTRIMYIVRQRDYVEVREQNVLKSGKWGSGKTIAANRYWRGDIECMDDNDRRILQKALDGGGYYVYLKDALPYLIGSDRIYTGLYAPFTPVIVEEEKPYLIVEKGKNGFTLNSNIPIHELRDAETQQHIIIKKSETLYSVIPLTDKQYMYYKRLLSVGKFPLEAEASLKAFLPQISQTVEVHSSLIEGGSTLDTLDGSAALCLQAAPSEGCYSLRIYAKPLPEGKAVFEPGKGDSRIVDEKEEVRYQVKRKLRQEKQNYEALTDYLEDALDKSSKTGELSLDTEGLLSILSYVRQHPEDYFMEWPEGQGMRLKASPKPASGISI